MAGWSVGIKCKTGKLLLEAGIVRNGIKRAVQTTGKRRVPVGTLPPWILKIQNLIQANVGTVQHYDNVLWI